MCVCAYVFFEGSWSMSFPQHKPHIPRFATSLHQTVDILRMLLVLAVFFPDVVSVGCVWLSKDGCPTVADHLTTDRTQDNELASTIVLSRDVLPTVHTTTL